MGRWDYEDSDEYRLPEGFQRVGYDADTQTYTFRDASGNTYESEPGNRYGELWPEGQGPQRSPAEIEARNAEVKKRYGESVRMFLPFALLAIIFLLLVFKFIDGGFGSKADKVVKVHCAEGAGVFKVQKGDTCYEIGKAYGVGVEELLGMEGNEDLDCDNLQLGQKICVPQ